MSPDPAMASLARALEREGRLARDVLTVSRRTRRRASAGDVAPFLHNTDARIDAALERPGPIIDIWSIN